MVREAQGAEQDGDRDEQEEPVGHEDSGTGRGERGHDVLLEVRRGRRRRETLDDLAVPTDGNLVKFHLIRPPSRPDFSVLSHR